MATGYVAAETQVAGEADVAFGARAVGRDEADHDEGRPTWLSVHAWWDATGPTMTRGADVAFGARVVGRDEANQEGRPT
jgi:hypothetical protein